MTYEGFPNPEILHGQSSKIEEDVLFSDLDFMQYTLESLRKFSGLNAVPRVICDTVTREYITFSMRPQSYDTVEEIKKVADSYRAAGFYVEVDSSVDALASSTVSLLISWSPAVVQSNAAAKSLPHEENYQLYLLVMQYIRAEVSLEKLSMNNKGILCIGDTQTRKWVSISILSHTMYREVLPVCEILWKFGYYVGIAQNPRRDEAWTLFVSWDPAITKQRPEHDLQYSFVGKLPMGWK